MNIERGIANSPKEKPPGFPEGLYFISGLSARSRGPRRVCGTSLVVLSIDDGLSLSRSRV